ncbi:hypothetical protein [Actinomadura hibisca]|uniref:hypothetical protein n=1 Tax=Actinomadura hibisca TaxID=68565 RepID=UPI000830039E|nr:hypothetical protein [Actinomadura hibisca]
MSAPVEKKVTAATTAAAVASFVVGLLVVKVPALAGLADILQAAIVGVITTALTGVAGWLAKHTPRTPARDGSYGR